MENTFICGFLYATATFIACGFSAFVLAATATNLNKKGLKG